VWLASVCSTIASTTHGSGLASQHKKQDNVIEYRKQAHIMSRIVTELGKYLDGLTGSQGTLGVRAVAALNEA